MICDAVRIHDDQSWGTKSRVTTEHVFALGQNTAGRQKISASSLMHRPTPSDWVLRHKTDSQTPRLGPRARALWA